ncbi:MAG: virulence factor Mce family protein [Acidimicrobiales bacterium]|jgi:phospholipid/cholesterol/gamma-HCH transport system substrate-binding protein|nr:virulence factor Mce family protein [Acidimicrobiales bacterium]
MVQTIIKLVAFFAVCAVFTAYLAFTIGNIHLFEHTYTLTAKFDDATGLLPDDNVKVAGVVVGKVKGVKIDQGRADVSFNVKQSVKVPTDSTIAIRWRNLIGQRYLYLYPGTAATVLKGGETVAKTRSVVDVGELFNRLGPIIKAIDPKEVNTFLDAIVQALDGNGDKIRQSIDSLAVVAQSLGARDQAIGRLVDNVNTVAGAINDRDAQIRTVLDNLVLISQTFSQNTDVLNTAVTQLGDFSDNFGSLLANNQVQIDRIISSLNAVVSEVKVKLPVVDSILGGLDEAAKRLFTSSRYGEWLNQVIPCGALLNIPSSGPVVPVNDPCVTGSGSTSAAGSQSQAASQTRGVAALNQILGQGLAQ